jgi:hypothetical protein
MALPKDLSETEHLQDSIRLVLNRQVREYFGGDVNPDSLDWRTNRDRLKWACYHKEEDTIQLTLARLHLFDTTCGRALRGLGNVYGTPSHDYDMAVAFKPQVCMYFKEDYADVDPNFAPVAGEISFRLATDDSGTITESKLRAVASKIRSVFASGNGYVWRKGKIFAWYKDRNKGYYNKYLVRDQATARELVRDVLSIQNHTVDFKKLRFNEVDDAAGAFPALPSKEYVLGKNRRMPRQRPIANVRFQHAVAHVRGVTNPIPLVDRSFRFQNAFEVVLP